MGSALAKTLVSGSTDLAVGNRSTAASEPLIGLATIFSTSAEYVRRADLVILCLSDYQATEEVLRLAEGSLKPGATVFQLASGTAEEARDLADWCGGRGLDYLDGKIVTYPARIGRGDSVTVYSGRDEVVNSRFADQLRLMAGASRFVADRHRRRSGT